MPTYDTNTLPSTTGIDLGATTQRWDGYFQNLDVSGTETHAGAAAYAKLNGIIYVDGTTYTTIASAIAAITEARGGLVIDMRGGSISEAGFTIPAGVTVHLGPGNYGFTSKIRMTPEGSHLIGTGSGNNGGTFIHHSGAIGNLVESFDTSGATYWHDCSIENLRIDMSQGGTNAGAHGIRIWNMGQSSSIRNVEVYNAIAAGIVLDGSPVPGSLENVSVYTSGTYGLDIDFGNDGDSAGNSISLYNFGGDNNTSGLVRLKTGNDRSIVNFYNLKSERNSASTVNNPVILADAFSGAINIFGGHFYTLTALAGTPTGDIIKTQTSGTPQIHIRGASHRLYSNVVNDTVNSRTITVQGNYIAALDYYNGKAVFAEYGSSYDTHWLSGAQEAIRLLQFGDTGARTAVLANSSITFGPGNAATDTTIGRAGANSLAISPIGTYKSIATVSNGVPAEYATVDLTAQTAAKTTTTLYAVPASGVGQYRVTWNAKVTTAATTGAATSTLGALTIVYTDPDSVVQTITAAAQVAAGTIATTSTGNSTTTVLIGLPLTLNCKASTNITYAMAYASDTANQMAYNLHIKLEALG